MREVEVNTVRDDERVGLGAAGGVGLNDILRESSPFGLGVEEPEPGDACEDMLSVFRPCYFSEGQGKDPFSRNLFKALPAGECCSCSPFNVPKNEALSRRGCGCCL